MPALVGVLMIAVFFAVFAGLILLYQAAFGGEPDPSGANAAFRFLDPTVQGSRYEPEHARRRLVLGSVLAFTVAGLLVVAIALAS